MAKQRILGVYKTETTSSASFSYIFQQFVTV